jgi:RiboL-PSP-HEPN
VAGKAKPSARQAFDDNMADAQKLVLFSEALLNKRTYKMRVEKRRRLGEALDIPKGKWDTLDCIESSDLFAVFPPGSRLDRDEFQDKSLRPLLRQALVAGCAALETFVGDRVMELWSGAVNAEERPTRLLQLPMTVDDWLRIERQYDRRRWGLRQVAELEVRRIASPAPAQIGIAFSIVGEKTLWKRVDGRRHVAKGKSEAALEALNKRRNKIAHEGDRVGVGRAAISAEEVDGDLTQLIDIVDAIDRETKP